MALRQLVSARMLLGAWLLLACCPAAHDAGPDYLIPFTWHGPNNQVNAIKETLALSILLGNETTVALPDLHTHVFTDGTSDPMPFEDLFDMEHLRKHLRVTLLKELRKGWDGKMDAVTILAKPQKENVAPLSSALNLEPPEKGKWFMSPVSSLLGCTPGQLGQLRALLQPYHVVGVQTFHGLVYGSHWLSGPPDCNGSACCEAFKAASALVRKSPRIHELAQMFVEQELGGGDYVAAHIRPYPDPCVKVWKSDKFDSLEERLAKMEDKCKNEYLYYRFPRAIKHLVVKYRTETVFIMSHPDIRPMVKERLEAEGIRPTFMELEHLQRDAAKSGPATGAFKELSFSLLAMVEEAVAAMATAFVGTKESSMTGTIVQERLSQGVSRKHTYSFYRNFTHRPANLDEYFEHNPLATVKPAGPPPPPMPPPMHRFRRRRRVLR